VVLAWYTYRLRQVALPVIAIARVSWFWLYVGTGAIAQARRALEIALLFSVG